MRDRWRSAISRAARNVARLVAIEGALGAVVLAHGVSRWLEEDAAFWVVIGGSLLLSHFLDVVLSSRRNRSA